MTSPLLSVNHLRVAIDDNEILHDVSLDVHPGEIVAIMGPNGSGKSTLSHALMGHPRYAITGGSAQFDGKNLLTMKPNVRATAGLFLSFQYPQEITGVPFGKFLKSAYEAVTGAPITVKDFLVRLDAARALLGIDRAFVERSVNEGFSGGEKKRAEILQLAVLEPRLAILDETDSGLDIDALKTVARGIQDIRAKNPNMAIVLITHYERFLEFLHPDRVFVMKDGRVVREGGREIADEIQKSGYEGIGA